MARKIEKTPAQKAATYLWWAVGVATLWLLMNYVPFEALMRLYIMPFFEGINKGIESFIFEREFGGDFLISVFDFLIRAVMFVVWLVFLLILLFFSLIGGLFWLLFSASPVSRVLGYAGGGALMGAFLRYVVYPRLEPAITAIVGFSLAVTLGDLANRHAHRSRVRAEYRDSALSLGILRRLYTMLSPGSQLIPGSELAVMQTQYHDLQTHPVAGQSALVTLAIEHSNRLKLNQRIKTLERWNEFCRIFTATVMEHERAAEQFYRVFGYFPPGVSPHLQDRIFRLVCGEIDEATFLREKREHERTIDRARWKRAADIEQAEDEARLEDALARKEEAQYRRLKAKMDRERLETPKTPAQPQRKPTRQERLAEAKQRLNEAESDLDGLADFPPDAKERIKEKLFDYFEQQVEELYGGASS